MKIFNLIFSTLFLQIAFGSPIINNKNSKTISRRGILGFFEDIIAVSGNSCGGGYGPCSNIPEPEPERICEDVNKDITKTEHKLNGFNVYDRINVETAIDIADGCSFPNSTFITETIGGLTEEVREFFKPVCNIHDMCYACQKGQSNCDKNLYKNMIELCANKYGLPEELKKEDLDSRSFIEKLIALTGDSCGGGYGGCSNIVDHSQKSKDSEFYECYEHASTIYDTVQAVGDIFSYNNYKYEEKARNKDLSDSCAYCGAETIKKILNNNEPFYTKSQYDEASNQ
ncbi:hypothetical protein BCR32DRAFT_326425 [Anaeromyces robustus]|uniref:Uncharacterized protein n=1 Tax=Anaeromyces robustus TaxID=1754192 RepID=A0A1Y1XCC8_9FUNG|nr:hypothetical protein BCR32DRAFT_326425 [Anaeromyces robustus]|eukprot:ORX83375.1 hypothetical protein BCR32DRAFT_326425 [Anaeromyces robustus]